MYCRVPMFFVVIVIAWASVAVAAGKVRTWSSSDGRTMQAEFVRELDGDVTFLKDGKLIILRLEKLSERDQQVVKDLSAGKEPEDDPFDAPNAEGKKPVEQRAETPRKSKKPLVIQTRTWTDRFGVKSSGKFVRIDGGNVVMNRGTRVISVPFANLSDADQEYVREVLTSQGKEAEIPEADAAAAGGANGGAPNRGFPPAGGGNNAGPGIPSLPPGIGPGGRGGGMPRGPRPSGGIGGVGPNPGPGVNGGLGMPPGMMPPVASGVGGPGIGPMPGPPNATLPQGMPGPIGGPMGVGLPGNNLPGSIPDTAMPPNGGIAAGGMPMPGMMPPTASMPPAGAMPGMASIPGTSGYGGSGFAPSPESPPMDRTSMASSPSMQLEEYFQCSKCNAKLTRQESLGTSCPHCNATWGFKQDQFGNKTMTAAGKGQISSIAAVIVIFVFLGVVVFIALFVGIIFAIVKATSSNAPRPVQPQHMPQQRYY